MNFIAALQIDSSRGVADMITEAIGENPEYFKTVYDLCFSQKYPVAMRAARVIFFATEKHPELMDPFLTQAFDQAMNSPVDGVRRCFMNIYSEIIDLEKIENLGTLLDRCFDIIMNPKEAIATRAYAIDFVLRIMHLEPELKHELIPVLEMLVDDESIGLRNKSRKLLAKLNKRHGP